MWTVFAYTVSLILCIVHALVDSARWNECRKKIPSWGTQTPWRMRQACTKNSDVCKLYIMCFFLLKSELVISHLNQLVESAWWIIQLYLTILPFKFQEKPTQSPLVYSSIRNPTVSAHIETDVFGNEKIRHKLQRVKLNRFWRQVRISNS